MGLKSLSQQAERAIFTITKIKNKCGDLPVEISFHLFDKLVLPILLYGAEVWGYERRDSIEAVHTKFCKYILCLPSHTSNVAVLGECGRLPLCVHYMYKCIKYWLKLVQSIENRYPKHLYNVLYNQNESGRTTWATKVKNVLYLSGFGYVWDNQSVGNAELFLSEFKQRLIDNR